MIGASKLFAKVVLRRLPAKVLLYELLNRLNRWLDTGNRRFEFERLYLEHTDPWNFRDSPYERRKYAHTLIKLLECRSRSDRALEVGCSIGIFSKSLAEQFKAVLAIDFSEQALQRAGDYCRENKNILFLRSNLQTLNVEGHFDVIICAEVLYYIAEDEAATVCRQLQRYLHPEGIIVAVNAMADNSDFWEKTLTDRFKQVLKETVADEARSFQIAIFQHP
jgi:2-polyprenyl-3-methyl-5-hydroxy-6-metoxy-1,4-benzoquinol methylase